VVSVFGLPECHLKPCTHAFRPFWLSPRQIVVIPVAAPFKDYAAKVAQTFHDAGLFAEVDVSDNTLNKKIRNAQTAQWNFIMGEASFVAVTDQITDDGVVVGQDEFEAQAVNIRNRDDEVQGREEVIKLDAALEKLVKLRDSRAQINKLE
jgi:threonyl-tRNA synthetase